MHRTRSRSLRRLSRRAAGDPLRMFCVGIGGVGLSGLASVASRLGHDVSGSDRGPSRATMSLGQNGVPISFEQDGGEIDRRLDLVVCSAAIPTNHPEVERARDLGVPVVKYSEALGALMYTREGMAIAGTHGKTTSSSMTAYILRDCGIEAGYIIGGEIPQLGGSAKAGEGPDLVVEACEYDRSFLSLEPTTGVILNIEADHFDCFPGGLDELLETFVAFGQRLRQGGTLIVNHDCPGAQRTGQLVSSLRPDLKIQTFGLGDGATLRARGLSFERGLARFELEFEGVAVGRVKLSMPGRHAVLNALAALAAASRTGLSWSRAATAISKFKGVERRFTVRHESADCVVIDDYAHHPTALRTILDTCRERYPSRRVVAVFEPHQHSRTRALFDDFSEALGRADEVFVTDIFRCRDSDEEVRSVSAAELVASIADRDPQRPAHHIRLSADSLRDIAASLKGGEVVVFMGAGKITKLAQSFAARTLKRELHRQRAAAIPRLATSVNKALCNELGQNLKLDEPLGRHLSFRAGGVARYYLEPKSVDELVHMTWAIRCLDLPFHVLGGGSNTLFRDEVFEGAVISTRALSTIERRGSTIVAEAGALLQKIIHRCEVEGLAGLEPLVGIPARLGGAVYMNAGGGPRATAMADFVKRVLLLESDGRSHWIDASEAAFGYRKSGIGERIVLAAELAGFKAESSAQIHQQRMAAARRKARVQPLHKASAGCIFQNGPDFSAGKLIDQLGLKGRRCGGARVSPKHGNFIVNESNATAADILTLIEEVRSAVLERSDRQLGLELEIKG